MTRNTHRKDTVDHLRKLWGAYITDDVKQDLSDVLEKMSLKDLKKLDNVLESVWRYHFRAEEETPRWAK